MRIRALAAVVAATVFTAGLTACSGGGSGPETIQLFEYQEARAKVAKKLIPKFEKAMKAKGEDVEVELVTDQLTDAQFKTKITQQLRSGKAPDVIDMGGTQVTGLAGAGYLLELDDYLDKWSGWDDYYAPVKTEAKQPDGHYYSIPHEASVQSLFYRKDVLQKYGVSTAQPKTWDELIGRLKQVSAKTKQPAIVIPAGKAWGEGTWTEGFLPLVGGTGSTFYDRGAGKWKVKSAGVDATFDLYDKLKKANQLPVQDLLNPNPWEPTKYEKFVKGTLPVSAQGTWGWRYDWGPDGAAPIKDVRDKVATWDYPALVEGTKPYSINGGGYVYSVNADSENADASVELAKWLSSGKPLAQQLTTVGAASPHSGISDLAPYKDDPSLLHAEKKVKTSVSVPKGDGADRVSQAAQDATEAILTGKADGKQASASFSKDAADLLGPNLVAK